MFQVRICHIQPHETLHVVLQRTGTPTPPGREIEHHSMIKISKSRRRTEKMKIVCTSNLLILYVCCLIISNVKSFVFKNCIPLLAGQAKRAELCNGSIVLYETRNNDVQQGKRKSKRKFAQNTNDRKLSVAPKSSLTNDGKKIISKTRYSEENQRKEGETEALREERHENKQMVLPQPASRKLARMKMIKDTANLSIEELEARLSKRWRTSVTAYDGSSVDSRRVVKSKPVIDPWSKEESLNMNQNDYIGLQRVKRFQDKFMVSEGTGDVELSLRQDEYYDDDDIEVIEDFEDDDKTLDILLAEQRTPSSQTSEKSSTLKSDKVLVTKDHTRYQESDQSGGFFFRQSSTDLERNNNEIPIDTQSRQEQSSSSSKVSEKVAFGAERKDKPKKESYTGKPLLDKDGNELLFTLDLARQQLKRVNNLNLDESNTNITIGGVFEKNRISNGVVASFDKESDSGIKSFKDIGITDNTILLNLERIGCSNPLPVQLASCTPILEGNDVLISTHTGSGKTVAFLAPLTLKIISRGRSVHEGEQTSSQQPQVFVVVPGRELASQVVAVARELLVGTKMKVGMAIGGTPFHRCYDTIRRNKPSIVVGTPGRIAELIVGREGEKIGKLKLSNCFSFVFDEFDALFQFPVHREPTMAIWNTVSKLHTQKKIQAVLCSATAADFSEEKLSQFLHAGYTHVSVGESDQMMTQGTKTRMSLTTIHGVIHLDHRRFAIETIRKILHTDPTPQQVLIFVNNARRVSIGGYFPTSSVSLAFVLLGCWFLLLKPLSPLFYAIQSLRSFWKMAL
jgi:hypothetical protein